MPSKRQVLEGLKRDELIAAVDRFELEVADRRVRDLLIEALASSRKARIAEVPGGFKRNRLKDQCFQPRLSETGVDSLSPRPNSLVELLSFLGMPEARCGESRTPGSEGGSGVVVNLPEGNCFAVLDEEPLGRKPLS